MSTTSQTRSTAYVVMQRIFEEGFATGDGSVADELCSPDLLDHQFGTAGHGADAVAHVRDAMRGRARGLPGHHVHDRGRRGVRDTIWVRVRAQGTATGRYFGPPSGRPVDFTVIDVCRVVDGRIVEHGECRTASRHSPRLGARPAGWPDRRPATMVVGALHLTGGGWASDGCGRGATAQALPLAPPGRAGHRYPAGRAGRRELFIERGYAVTTVADIARRARGRRGHGVRRRRPQARLAARGPGDRDLRKRSGRARRAARSTRARPGRRRAGRRSRRTSRPC